MNIQSQKDRIDITGVIERHVALKRNGQNLTGLCPFHTEKTPSFTVSPAKQFYCCFGCGEHGDAIDFVRKFHGYDFKQACKYLNIDLPENDVRLSKAKQIKSRNQKKTAERRKARRERLEREFQTWLFWYEGILVDLLETMERIGPTIKPDELDYLAGCILKKSTWRSQLWLIQNGAEDDKYELWSEYRDKRNR